MGRKLDALLGRRSTPSKLKGTARLAVARLPTLKTQRRARCSTARSDVVEFLNSANHERALLRVEQVIKEQNMLDVFVALEGYCNLLVERINLFEQEKFCPDELIEAVSTLIYASTRCGDFPELMELRAVFTAKFGKEFVQRAVELRNNCGVNPRVIQKLSTKIPSLENKMEVLKEIAMENNIELPISDTKLQESSNDSLAEEVSNHKEEDEVERGPRRKYKDVADAAQAAFESAAYAAAAARAAVELSRSESTDHPDDPTKSDKIHPVPDHDSGDKGSSRSVSKSRGMEEFKANEGGSSARSRRSFSSSSSDSSDEEGDVKGKELVLEEKECEEKRNEGAAALDISRKPISVRSRWARAR